MRCTTFLNFLVLSQSCKKRTSYVQSLKFHGCESMLRTTVLKHYYDILRWKTDIVTRDICTTIETFYALLRELSNKNPEVVLTVRTICALLYYATKNTLANEAQVNFFRWSCSMIILPMPGNTTDEYKKFVQQCFTS